MTEDKKNKKVLNEVPEPKKPSEILNEIPIHENIPIPVDNDKEEDNKLNIILE